MSRSFSLSLSLSLLILLCALYLLNLCEVLRKRWAPGQISVPLITHKAGVRRERQTARAFFGWRGISGVLKIACIGWGVRSDWCYHGDSRKGDGDGIEVLELDQTAEKGRDKGVETGFVMWGKNAQVFCITAAVEWKHHVWNNRQRCQNWLQTPVYKSQTVNVVAWLHMRL